MKKFSLKIFLSGLLLMATGAAFAQELKPIHIIPQPVKVEQSAGTFTLPEKVVIAYDASMSDQAQYLQELLAQSTGRVAVLKAGKTKGTIVLQKSNEMKPEGYALSVTPKGIRIKAADPNGAFYGIQSLLQLFPAEIYSARWQRHTTWEAPCVEIADAPERPWRGMMLDVARYFYDKTFVKKYIDMMAMYKLNKLQFHLIDDSGWRLEIKKYPRLTEVGAWAGPDAKRLGGFYTQEDIRELVAYAKVRGVELIPEIEFPAHILSAVVAYPWLSCTGLQHEMPTQHFISRDLLCAGKETSIQFLKDVMEETAELFPSAYVNIGGDEAVYKRWEQCPDCQALMKREGLSKASELQGYLTNVVAKMMKEKNRTLIGWEEIIMRGKVNEPVVALIWHNVADSIHATNTGHKAILTPATHMYLDFPEKRIPGEVQAATWMPPISLEKCYSMPVNDYSAQSTVIGVQGCYWSDQFIHGNALQELTPLHENRSENYAEYLTFPRLLALSEVAWMKQSQRNFEDFRTRLGAHFAKMDHKECHYRLPEPRIIKEEKMEGGETRFTLTCDVPGAEIKYTTNGKYPTVHSPKYTAPITLEKREDLRAITVVSPSQYSLPLYFAPDYSAYKAYGEHVFTWEPLRIQTKPAQWRFEVTGKISGNGTYELTVIPTRGDSPVQLGNLKLWKRQELMAEVQANTVVKTEQAPFTYRFTLDGFEAGTPFHIELEGYAPQGNNTSGMMFLRRIENQ
jgi:hexosaminidase